MPMNEFLKLFIHAYFGRQSHAIEDAEAKQFRPDPKAAVVVALEKSTLSELLEQS